MDKIILSIRFYQLQMNHAHALFKFTDTFLLFPISKRFRGIMSKEYKNISLLAVSHEIYIVKIDKIEGIDKTKYKSLSYDSE